MARPILYLIGQKRGLPTLEDILVLSKALRGRDATSEEIEAAEKILAKIDISSQS